ncbi:MAG: sigma-54-dependent Fis family transcriptional regulator [Gemmatimonadetes bacterium]|nr:sigma-54-dependent Fis family transcriptional regulator [Gemmatimonadota bacterium]
MEEGMSEYPGCWNDEWNDLPKDMRHFATQFGPADDHVLLLGPPGSGKGYLAQILHELSPRAGGPFVQQNCGAITESLAEATLFGSMKGAYTGATESKAGVVEAAAGGTLFLDEFGALPSAIQAMLLIFLEKREFRRVGSTTVREASVRVIAATNRDLGEAIRAGEFRVDLVGRLPLRYKVPPLRERRGEIAGIVDRYSRENGVEGELADDAMSRLRSHEWRGNIRELVSVLKYCAAVAKGGLITLDLVEAGIRNQQIGMEPSTEAAKPRKAKSDEDMKRELVQALKATGGNKSEAARLVGIHRTTFHRRLKKYGVGRSE